MRTFLQFRTALSFAAIGLEPTTEMKVSVSLDVSRRSKEAVAIGFTDYFLVNDSIFNVEFKLRASPNFSHKFTRNIREILLEEETLLHRGRVYKMYPRFVKISDSTTLLLIKYIPA